MITGACSDFADKRDSQCLEQIVELTEENLKENGIELEELLADGGYSSGEALAYFCMKKNINAYIPNFGQYKPEREGFTFNKEENYYQCTKPEGKSGKLLFKGEKGIVKATPNERTEVAKQIAKLSTKRTMLWQKHQVQKIRRQHPQRTLRPHAPKLTQNEKYAKKNGKSAK